jgi:hypothetical protein
MSNFIIIIEEIKKPKLKIAIKWNSYDVSEFIDLKNSAFIHHPNCPTYYDGFTEYKSASAARLKWRQFLENYLKLKL